MDPLVCFPDPLPTAIQSTLRRTGYDFRAVDGPELIDALERSETKAGWSGALVCGVGDLAGALGVCSHLRRREVPLAPLLLVVSLRQMGELQLRDELFDDFCVAPLDSEEVAVRLGHLFWRAGRGAAPGTIEHGPLVLNVETYQAAVSGRALDLTYMEYELLRFLAAHPGKVFTRETLLNRVWGYEYYGGARTVDVHIRRLRAKLGEEHAHLIHTVRSVGYSFGQASWAPGAGNR